MPAAALVEPSGGTQVEFVAVALISHSRGDVLYTLSHLTLAITVTCYDWR